MKTCFPFHDWTEYEAPKSVKAASVEGPTMAQRRECRRCKAVDYRRVLVHN